MGNVLIVLAENILKHRKKKGLSQEELAQKLGVTFQAVSKWENAKSAPDITFLPIMADVFGCHIDELFSREIKMEDCHDHCSEFPWSDDSVIRCLVCEGRKILQATENPASDVVFKIIGNAKEVICESDIIVEGNVIGGCVSQGNISVGGSITGECTAEGNIESKEWIMGECTAGGNIIAGGNITGDCCANKITKSKNLSFEE